MLSVSEYSASVGRTRKHRTKSATGFKLKSGWLVFSSHAQLTPQKRNWLGKESITARFRRLLLRRTVLVNARRLPARIPSSGNATTSLRTGLSNDAGIAMRGIQRRYQNHIQARSLD